MKIPLVDLARQHALIEDVVLAGIADVMAKGTFILGPPVADFEAQFASFSGVKHCVGVGNGTDALELSLRALDVGPGDEVVLPANTFIATALAVVRAGATPVLVDCEPDSYLMDVDQLPDAITNRTRAIIPVHLYGQLAPVELIREVVGSIPIVEDGAQAQGATRHGYSMGAIGTVAATSFYPGKNLGAYGDAGAVLSNDDELADRVRRLRNWGSDTKYHHPEIGFNSRLDTLQAVVLGSKLTYLAEWNRQRQDAARRYDELLADADLVLPATSDGNEHVWHLYVVRVRNRNQVLKDLNESGVGSGIHYPTPVHLHGAMSGYGLSKGDFPVAERVAGEILSLPLFPGITADEQEYVAASLARALAEEQ